MDFAGIRVEILEGGRFDIGIGCIFAGGEPIVVGLRR